MFNEGWGVKARPFYEKTLANLPITVTINLLEKKILLLFSKAEKNKI